MTFIIIHYISNFFLVTYNLISFYYKVIFEGFGPSKKKWVDTFPEEFIIWNLFNVQIIWAHIKLSSFYYKVNALTNKSDTPSHDCLSITPAQPYP